MRCLCAAVCLLATVSCTTLQQPTRTVRVRSTNEVPQILIDGKPVRARMFWGAPGRSSIPVKAGARMVSFELTATDTELERATMHFRFGAKPGRITLDDIQVTDLTGNEDVVPTCGFEAGQDSFDKDWTFWPQDETNTVATVKVASGAGRDGTNALCVDLREPESEKWPDFHVYHHPNLALREGHRYRVSFWCDTSTDRELIIAFYRPGAYFTLLAAPRGPFEEQICMAADAGIDFVSFPCPLPWPKPGESVDWRSAEAACLRVLRENPKALLIPRIGMEPPRWWKDAHPEHVMQWEDGPRNRGVVVASPLYRRDAAKRLGMLVRHLEETFGDSMAGYHPCGQNTGEWFYQETWGQQLSGYAPAACDAWRRWLRDTYGNDKTLRLAWDDPVASITAAVVPAPEVRHAAPAGVLRDPAREQAVIDFNRFLQDAMADCVTTLAKTVRDASRGRKLVVFFYGYGFEFGAVGTGPAMSGHYGLRRVLESPDIDILCSPISYWDRGLGGSAPAMSAAESVTLAGKMWLYEDDTHTYLATGTPPGWKDHVDNLRDTNAQLVRNVAEEALRNFGTWWMDLRATGWFSDTRMWDEMKRLEALDLPLLENPVPFRPDVAAIVDEKSMPYVAQGGNTVTRPSVYEVRRAFGRMGAPYGQYLLDDVTADRVDAKLRVFLNAYSVPEAARIALRSSSPGHVSVWCYAPGVIGCSGEDLNAARELTGFRLAPVSPEKAWAEPATAGKAMGLMQGFGIDKAIQPLYAVADADESEVLARYPDGSAAIAMRRAGDGVSIFVGVPGLTSEFLRFAARQAGVHLYTETDCNVYANGPFLAVHAPEAGSYVLNTGTPGAVTDVLTGKAVGNGPAFKLDLERGETRVMRY